MLNCNYNSKASSEFDSTQKNLRRYNKYIFIYAKKKTDQQIYRYNKYIFI